MNTYMEFDEWETETKKIIREGIIYPECFQKYLPRIQKRLQKEYIYLLLKGELSIYEGEKMTGISDVGKDFRKLVDNGICEYIVKKRKVGTIIQLKEDHTIQFDVNWNKLYWCLIFYKDTLNKKIQILDQLRQRKVEIIEKE